MLFQAVLRARPMLNEPLNAASLLSSSTPSFKHPNGKYKGYEFKNFQMEF
jgi:hypothetical protein